MFTHYSRNTLRIISLITLLSFTTNVFAEVTVAVMDFSSNTGNEREDAMLSVGTTETITSDLARIKSIVPLERSKIEDVCKEIGLGQSGLFDEATAQKAGRMLGAKYVILGSWQKFDTYRLNARMVEVETGRIVAASKRTGETSQIFDIQDYIIEDIFSQVNIQLTSIEKNEIRIKETESINAYESYSMAKKAQYADNEQMAKYYAKEALSFDPNYQKAKNLLSFYGDAMAVLGDKYSEAIDEGGAGGLGKAWLFEAGWKILIWIPPIAGVTITVIAGAPFAVSAIVFGAGLTFSISMYLIAKRKRERTHPKRLALISKASSAGLTLNQQLQKKDGYLCMNFLTIQF